MDHPCVLTVRGISSHGIRDIHGIHLNITLYNGFFGDFGVGCFFQSTSQRFLASFRPVRGRQSFPNTLSIRLYLLESEADRHRRHRPRSNRPLHCSNTRHRGSRNLRIYRCRGRCPYFAPPSGCAGEAVFHEWSFPLCLFAGSFTRVFF